MISVPQDTNQNLLTPKDRLKAIWLFDREGFLSILLKKELKKEAMVFYALPIVLLVIILSLNSLYLLAINPTNFIDLIVIFLIPVIEEIISLLLFLSSTYIFIKIGTIESKKSYIYPKAVLSVFSYVYFSRIFLIIGFAFLLLGVLLIATLFLVFFLFYFLALFAFSMRSATSNKVIFSMFFAYIEFFLFLTPYLLF